MAKRYEAQMSMICESQNGGHNVCVVVRGFVMFLLVSVSRESAQRDLYQHWITMVAFPDLMTNQARDDYLVWRSILKRG